MSTLFGGLALVAPPAHADISQILDMVQRNGAARVVISLRTGDATHSSWTKGQPVELQRQIVASAQGNLARKLQVDNIPITRSYVTLPFTGAIVNGEQLMQLVAMSEVQSVRLVEMEHKLPVSKATGVEKAQTVSLDTSVASIDVPAAWAAGYTGKGETVAILDGGFNVSHPMLSGKNVGDACFADTYQTTLKAECPSGSTPQIGSGAASYCPTYSDGTNRCDHGSNVSSIAVGNDGTNMGVAKDARFMPIDVFSADYNKSDCDPDPTPCEVTDQLAVLDALDYVNQNSATYNIVAVNLSAGGKPTSSYCDDDPRKVAVDNLRAKGIAVAIAAGNDGDTGEVDEPACISSSEAVGATDSGSNVADFSNFSTKVDFMAPGVSIRAAAGSGNNFVTMGGTSMASPHIAGAWAIMRSALPAASADQIETALKNTGIQVTRAGTGFTVPKIQVMHAINTIAGPQGVVLNQVISSAANTIGLSYVRLYNNSSTAGTVTFSIHDPATGTALGTWATPSIAAHASSQFAITDIERNATPTGQGGGVPNGRSAYNLQVASTFKGYMQYVLWSSNLGMLGNMTSCSSGPATDGGATLMYVDAASQANYVSHIRIVNTGAASATATLTYNTVDGQQVAQWTSPSIPSGGSLDVTEPSIEGSMSALSNATTTGATWYNINLTNFYGYMQHVIENTGPAVLTDVTGKCALTVAGS